MPIALALGAEPPLPKFDSALALEQFLFPADEEAIFNSMQVAFRLDNPGWLVTAAANLGPAYASKVAASIEFPEFRAQYAQLAHYLELFGPCQKKQKAGENGWWSGYGPYPGDAYCQDAAKLIFANTLWSQVHYCRQLATGAAKSKAATLPGHAPPYRLDEPPVKTPWLNAAAIYSLADAAIALRLDEVLRRRAAQPEREPAEREAIADAEAELSRMPVDRELVGLALAKMMVRNYESVHLRHLRRLPGDPPPSATSGKEL
jgi:hypothetical protein